MTAKIKNLKEKRERFISLNKQGKCVKYLVHSQMGKNLTEGKSINNNLLEIKSGKYLIFCIK